MTKQWLCHIIFKSVLNCALQSTAISIFSCLEVTLNNHLLNCINAGYSCLGDIYSCLSLRRVNLADEATLEVVLKKTAIHKASARYIPYNTHTFYSLRFIFTQGGFNWLMIKRLGSLSHKLMSKCIIFSHNGYNTPISHNKQLQNNDARDCKLAQVSPSHVQSVRRAYWRFVSDIRLDADDAISY